MVFEFVPNPNGEVFGGRVFEKVVEVGVVDAVDDFVFDDVFDDFKVHDHAVFLDGAFDGDDDFVVVAVEVFAFAVVFCEKVGGGEVKGARELHSQVKS